MNYFRTAILLAALTALFMAIGFMFGGQSGMLIAFLVAAGMNLFAYWNSDKMVLRMYGAREVDERSAPDLYRMTRELAANAGIPMPRLYVMDNPQNGAVAVTTGLMQLVNKDEVAGVIAHELAHIKNRDTLIMTITATIAGAISMLANFGLLFGGGRNDNNPFGAIGLILMVFLAPLAAGLVQMAISRTREYAADRQGAEISGNPMALATALQKISGAAHRIPNMEAERNPASAHLFIVNPLSGARMDNLFSTHPNVENRVAQLTELARTMGRSGARASAEAVDTGPWSAPRAGNRGPWG